jgi:hypothetical protein
MLKASSAIVAIAVSTSLRFAIAPVITRDDYELWPRGRIIYERTPDRFVVDADRQRLAPPWLAQIITLFHLPPARTTARSDLHYRSTRAIGPP